MKKILLILIILTLAQGLMAKKRFSLSVDLNIMSSETRAVTYRTVKNEGDDPDTIYRMSVTGDWFPEVKLRMDLFGGLYAWGGFGFSYTKIQFSDIQASDITLFKTGVSGGLGLTVFGYKEVDNLSLSLEMGYAFYKLSGSNDVEDINLKKSGLVTQLVFTYLMNERLFLEANVGFSSAYDNYKEARIKLGGFRIGLGGGIRF